MDLFKQWLALGAHHHSMFRSPRGIAQGAILSPLMCNIYLHQLDQKLATAHIPFVRFADDFLLFSSTESQAMAAKSYVAKQLDKLGLTLHPEKTAVIIAGPKHQFLGEKLPYYDK